MARPRPPAGAPAAPGAPAGAPNLKTLITEKKEKDALYGKLDPQNYKKRKIGLLDGYQKVRKDHIDKAYEADHEGHASKASEYWQKVKENCRHAEQNNKAYADFVVVLVTMFQDSMEMSKAIKATIAASFPKFAAYQDAFALAREIKGVYKRHRTDADPNESKKGMERVIGKNLTPTLGTEGELDISYKIRGQEVNDEDIKEALDTLLVSYFQEKGFEFEVVPGKVKPRLVYGPNHTRCLAPGAPNFIAPYTPIERADFDKLVENDCEEFKEFAQDIMDHHASARLQARP